jgi:predicted enzyme related to lactoylglutathione lyase
MSDRYIPGVPCWTDITPPDAEAAVEFYGGLFGWEFENVLPEGSPGKYLIGRIRGGDVGAISSPPEGEQPPIAWNTYVWVDSADDTVAKVREAGGTVLMEPMDVFDSGRMAMFADPEGAVLSIWQANQHKGSQIVNEHGSVNFNNLNTRDLEGAKRFYGAVFGWKTLDLGGSYMWTLPGYGDYLEELTPGTRDNFAEMGAPGGFIDAVAGLMVIPDDQPDLPVHWGVTFAVDDADATAALANELGGHVLQGPFDAPWVRMSVITDPQGAMFIASQFVPENKDLGAEV